MAARPKVGGLHSSAAAAAAALRSQCPVSLVGGVCTLTVCADIIHENQWFLLGHDCASACDVAQIMVL